MIAVIHIPQEIFAHDYMETVTKIKLYIKTSPAPPNVYLHINIVCLKINRVPLNDFLQALCCFSGGGYTHAALETV